MKPSEVLRISWEAILKNKVRSLLTMLGIIIGVAAVIIMVGISAGTSATIEESITSLGSNLVYVDHRQCRWAACRGCAVVRWRWRQPRQAAWCMMTPLRSPNWTMWPVWSWSKQPPRI